MAISKEQWAEIEAELRHDWGAAVFRYEEMQIYVVRKYVSEGRTKLAVYLDGEINFLWGFKQMGVAEERFRPVTEKLWRKRSKSLYSPQKQKSLIKEFGKREAESIFEGLYDKQIWFEPDFPKSSVLVNQYKRLRGMELETLGVAAYRAMGTGSVVELNDDFPDDDIPF